MRKAWVDFLKGFEDLSDERMLAELKSQLEKILSYFFEHVGTLAAHDSEITELRNEIAEQIEKAG